MKFEFLQPPLKSAILKGEVFSSELNKTGTLPPYKLAWIS